VTALWHPFADMTTVDGHELVIVRGEGVHVWDADGTRYLDGAASLWSCNVGHGRREIVEAVTDQMRQLEAYHVFGDVANPPALELAARLAALAPTPGSKVFLTSGGADSIDTAAKLARLWHAARGASGRTHLISREHAYHGTHGIATSILGMPYREGFGELVAETSRVAWDDAGALEDEILRLGPERVAAFVFEPVIGAGGVLVPPAGYLDAVVDVCRRHGVLTIADAVIGGFGRLGEWLAVERFGLEPDMIVFAKGVTSGYLPLGGVIASARVAEPFWTEPGRPFSHGATYSGHPACCAAALANLEVLARDGLVHRARALEGPFHDALRVLEAHPLVGEVRGGVGLMAAVALDPAAVTDLGAAATELWAATRRAGLLTRWLWDGVAVAPPLTIEAADVAEAVGMLRQGLAGVASRR
jgi:adenosylmethionine-8-amino-7-oxononanoate aminotransferase